MNVEAVFFLRLKYDPNRDFMVLRINAALQSVEDLSQSHSGDFMVLSLPFLRPLGKRFYKAIFPRGVTWLW